MANAIPHPKPAKPRHFIKEWRKFRGLSQQRLADRLGLTHGAISQLERGLVNYTQGTLEALADALSCQPGDLISVDPYKDGEVIDLVRMISERNREAALTMLRALATA